MIGILKALGTTLKTSMRRPVTVQYPEVHVPLPERTRIGFPLLLWDHDIDEPFCTGCQACERACPVECITVTMRDNPKQKEGESKRRKIVDFFLLDYGRCMRCNICVEVCNFDAIAMNNTWSGPEASVYDRRELVMDTDELLAKSRAGEVRPWMGALGSNED
jgi:formate hydrogenlyase subunit 6/NADH:ubiquinone oxidoreductase subunit I